MSYHQDRTFSSSNKRGAFSSDTKTKSSSSSSSSTSSKKKTENLNVDPLPKNSLADISKNYDDQIVDSSQSQTPFVSPQPMANVVTPTTQFSKVLQFTPPFPSSQSSESSQNSKGSGIVNESTITETPKRTKFDLSDVLSVTEALGTNGTTTISAKLIEKAPSSTFGSIIRVADKDGCYADIKFDQDKQTEYNRLQQDGTYFFFKVLVENPLSRLLVFTTGSTVQNCRKKIDIDTESIPKMIFVTQKPPEKVNLPDEPNLSTIPEMFENAEKIKEQIASGIRSPSKFFCKANILAYVTQAYPLLIGKDGAPIFCFKVVDQNFNIVKIKVFSGQKHLIHAIQKDKAYVFKNFSVIPFDGKYERSLLTMKESSVTEKTINWNVPANIGKQYVIGYKLGTLRVFKICNLCPKRASVDSASACYNCFQIVNNADALAGFTVVVSISEDPDCPIGDEYVIFDDSFRALFEIDPNLKFQNVSKNREAEFEKNFESDGQNLIWEVAGDTYMTGKGNPAYNIRYAHGYD